VDQAVGGIWIALGCPCGWMKGLGKRLAVTNDVMARFYCARRLSMEQVSYSSRGPSSWYFLVNKGQALAEHPADWTLVRMLRRENNKSALFAVPMVCIQLPHNLYKRPSSRPSLDSTGLLSPALSCPFAFTYHSHHSQHHAVQVHFLPPRCVRALHAVLQHVDLRGSCSRSSCACRGWTWRVGECASCSRRRE
jgi:hypothetical protein